MPTAELRSDHEAAPGPVAAAVAERFVARWPAMRPFVVIGVPSIVAGGLVAAVSRPTGFDLGPWLAAFLVLVSGVAQLALGIGQAWLAADPPARPVVRVELVTWNVGIAATVAGSLSSAPVVSTIGSVATAAALAVFLGTVGRGAAGPGSRDRVLLVVYRLIVLVVLLSTPIGLVLAWTRHG